MNNIITLALKIRALSTILVESVDCRIINHHQLSSRMNMFYVWMWRILEEKNIQILEHFCMDLDREPFGEFE